LQIIVGFKGGFIADYASTNQLEFVNCAFEKAISAQCSTLRGDLSLLWCLVDGEVNLYGANVGGDLACDGATLLNPKGRALELTNAEIKRDLTLRSTETANKEKKRFHSRGEVCLHEAKIDGTLSCSGGLF
jgi:hypothetical protein